MSRKTTEERFWEKVDKKGPDDCWLWMGCKKEKGYGAFNGGNKTLRVHRYSWELHNDIIPKQLQVFHKCEYRHCVNPNHLYIGLIPFSIEERFWGKVNKDDPSGCWLWKEGLFSSGYGAFKTETNNMGAHRYSWELHNGSIPDGLNVCHRCDVRNCVNPEHLFLGTQQDNIDDMFQKGRNNHLKGEELPQSKLRDSDVMYIRKLWHWTDGKSCVRITLVKKMADLFGVGEKTIRKVIQRKCWTHI